MEETKFDTDDLRSFLTVFRTFISESEPIFLGSIFSICHKRLTDERIKGYLADARRTWATGMKHAPIRLVIDGEDLTPERVMDIWVNGWYLHLDTDYREYVKRIERLNWLEAPILRNHFYISVVTATNLILYLWSVVDVCLRDGGFMEDAPSAGPMTPSTDGSTSVI